MTNVAPAPTLVAPFDKLLNNAHILLVFVDGIDWRCAATMLAVALRDADTSDAGCRVTVRADAGHTVFARSRPLNGVEVGVNHPVTDASSRPIVVTEGVVVAGQIIGDPEIVLRAAQSQFSRVIRDFWNDAARFDTPRVSEPVTCRLPSAEPGGDSVEPLVHDDGDDSVADVPTPTVAVAEPGPDQGVDATS